MVAVARENSDAIKVGCRNLVMWLLDGAERFASLFCMVRSLGSATASESENCSAGVRWAINDVLLARIADVDET
jgi:hypothetical protein